MDVIIKLSDNGQIRVESIGPVKQSKFISKEDLFSILLSSVDTIEKYETPLPLPKNCIYYKKHGSKELFVLEKKAHRRNVTYYGKVFQDVGFPKLLFGYVLDHKYNSIKTSIVAVKNDLFIKSETEIFRYPFSNVYSNTECCWGTCTFPKLDHPYQLSGFPELYLSQEDNGDLYDGANSSGLMYREFLMSLQGKDFNMDWLLPNHVGKTFQSYCNYLIIN